MALCEYLCMILWTSNLLYSNLCLFLFRYSYIRKYYQVHIWLWAIEKLIWARSENVKEFLHLQEQRKIIERNIFFGNWILVHTRFVLKDYHILFKKRENAICRCKNVSCKIIHHFNMTRLKIRIFHRNIFTWDLWGYAILTFYHT